MIIQIVIFLIISTGGVLCSAVWNKKYEEALPLTTCSIVIILFLAGICGFLKGGVYIVLFICLGLYIFSGVWLTYKKQWKNFFRKFFTPGFVCFIVLFLFLTFLNRGKLAVIWDEFSHWALSVKSMVRINDFGTAANSGVLFKSYPPAMTLFQYFVQRISILIAPMIVFNEWRLYFAYQIFFLTFLFPFFKNITYKQWLLIFVSVVTIYLSPLIFFKDIYNSIYIDSFLGIISGAGFAMIFCWDQKDIFYKINILFCISILVLSKDAGLMFAVFLLIVFLADELFFRSNNILTAKKINKKQWIFIISGICSVIIPKFLWNLNIKTNGVISAFSGKVDLKELVKVFIRRDNTYKTTVADNFFKAIFNSKVSIGDTGINIPYFVFVLLLFGAIYLLYYNYKKHDLQNARLRQTIFWILCVQVIVYIVGLCIMYMFKFSEYEAVRLASFSRYVYIIFLSVWVFIIMSFINLLQYQNDNAKIYAVLLLCMVFTVTPWSSHVSFLNRSYVKESITMRKPYIDYSNHINNIENKDANIYIISQQDKGLDYYILKYEILPFKLSTPSGYGIGYSWSIGKPFYEGDIWTATKTAEEWQKELVDKYDYVALYKLNDYFKENFASVFANPLHIKEKALYKVNKETGLLELCG